jgi:hypothetical protein
MALAGDPLEPRFKMKVGTAQAGDPFSHGGAQGAAVFVFEWRCATRSIRNRRARTQMTVGCTIRSLRLHLALIACALSNTDRDPGGA